ncbi:M23 family metallopeptidase [Gemmiger sp.]
MWENAAPPPENEPSKPPARRPKSEEDLVLWAQILLCLAAIGFVLAAKFLAWPVYPELRRAFAAAMQPDQTLLLTENRNLVKFTEQTAEELADSARSMWDDFIATPESARAPHGKASPPAYAREDAYTPDFPLRFPLPGQSRKTSGYGWRTDPMGGLGDDFHIGNDLAAAEGTPVLAAADGVVRAAGSHKSYGNYIRILHGDGDETLYAHMQYLFVKAGETVTAGQTLGTVGETGNATGPHLHFEILHRGLRYDPAEALQNAS